MARTSVAVVFAGSGGAGAMTAGAVFLRAAAHAGYYGLMTQLFGAQVRGGESAALVQISTAPVDSPPDRYDLFVALDWDKVEQFAAEIPLDETSVVLADPAAGAVPGGIAKSKARAVWLAMSESKGKPDEGERRLNMVAVGAVAALAGIDAAHVPPAIDAIYSGKDAALDCRQ